MDCGVALHDWIFAALVLGGCARSSYLAVLPWECIEHDPGVVSMNGYITDIETATIENGDFRRVLYTAQHSQIVLMSLLPGEEIGEEVHELDQFFRVEMGSGVAVLEGVEHLIADGTAIVVPQGAMHNIINTGEEPLKLYTIYSPPNHRDGVVHKTKEEAEADGESFDGATTE